MFMPRRKLNFCGSCSMLVLPAAPTGPAAAAAAADQLLPSPIAGDTLVRSRLSPVLTCRRRRSDRRPDSRLLGKFLPASSSARHTTAPGTGTAALDW